MTDRQRREAGLRLAVAPLRGVEIREPSSTGDGSWTIAGYAAVYEQETTLYDIPGWARMDEEIALGAFDRVLERLGNGDGLVHLNHGHDMKTAMAASDVDGIGGLKLTADHHGLRMFARVDQRDRDAQALAIKMDRGVVRQSSFAFYPGDDEMISEDVLDDGTYYTKWRINEIADLFDVCVCAQGAYPTTESYLRSLAAASLRVPDPGAFGRGGLDLSGLRRLPERGGASPVAHEAGGSDDKERQELALHASTIKASRKGSN